MVDYVVVNASVLFPHYAGEHLIPGIVVYSDMLLDYSGFYLRCC